MMEDVFRLRDLNNAYNSYEELCVLANYIINSGAEQIVLDCAAVDFVASNLFAVLGCLFAEKLNGKKLRINNVKEPLQKIIQKSGFYRHFKGLSGLPDKYNTITPYRVFNVMDIEQYEKYLTIELFARDDLPVMSRGVKDSIKDYLLEVFNNVYDHTECRHIYTCGQYFPKMGMLFGMGYEIGKYDS